MRPLCVVWIWIIVSGLGETTKEIITHGYSGKSVTIMCSYKWASKNIKYFCRDPCTYATGVLVSSDYALKGRFRLEDFGERVFTVTISDLQLSDSGVYWCGVRRTPKDTYTKVHLEVFTDPNESISTSTQAHKEEDQTVVDFHSSTSPEDSESPSTTAITTVRSPIPEGLRFSNSDSVSQYISLYDVGLPVIAVIILLAGLVTVHQYRKRVKTAETETSDNRRTEHTEEGTYNNTETKEKTEVKNKTNSIYQNLDLSMGQSNEVYESI